jgi:hypothetical protein
MKILQSYVWPGTNVCSSLNQVTCYVIREFMETVFFFQIFQCLTLLYVTLQVAIKINAFVSLFILNLFLIRLELN